MKRSNLLLHPSLKGAAGSSTAFALLAASLSFLLGVTVIFGWHTHNPFLIQVHPSWVGMVYNAALGFVLCGFSLMAIALRRRRLALVGGLYGVAMGGINLLQFVFNTNFGVDELFMKHYITSANTNPGRMAINTAVCFILVGCIFLLLNSRIKPKAQATCAGLLGSVVVGFGLIAFSGYLTGITSFYSWGGLTRMAVHTALAFVTLGIGFIALAWRSSVQAGEHSPRWLPISVALGILTMTVGLWQALLVNDRLKIEVIAQLEANAAKNQVEDEVGARIRSLHRMAKRWEHSDSLQSRTEWENDAREHIKGYGGYESIEWVDSKLQVQWSVLQGSGEPVQNRSLEVESQRIDALRIASRANRIVITQAVELSSNGYGTLICVPISREGRAVGFIVGTLNLKTLFDSMLPPQTRDGYSIRLFDASQLIYSQDWETSTQRPVKEALINIGDVQWKLQISPKQSLMTEHRTWLPLITLITGFLLSGLAALSFYLGQTIRERSEKVVVVNQALRNEITQREKVANELRESQERLRESQRQMATLMNNIPGLVYRCLNDADWTMQFVSKGCEELTGYSPENLIGNQDISYAQLIHPDDSLHVTQTVEHAIENKKPFELTYRICTRSGEEKWVWEQGDGVWAHNGELLWLEGLILDITERKQAEENRAQLAEIVELSEDAIYSSTLGGNVISWNRGAEKLYGYTAGEILGQSVGIIIPPERQDEASDSLEKILQGQLAGNIETQRVHQDGRRIDVSLTLAPVKNSVGQIIGASTIAHNVTTQKQIERILREQARRAELNAHISNALASNLELQEVLQQCTEALTVHLDAAFTRIWTLDSSGKVLELQASAGQYTHVDGGHARVAVGEFKIGRIAERKLPHLTNDVLHDTEISDHKWAEQEGMVAFAGYPLLVDGYVVGVMALFARHPLSESVLSDLATLAGSIAQYVERKRAEEALADNVKELARSNKELEQFAYIASHDLQEPLRTVASFTQLLAKRYQGQLDEKADLYIHHAVDATSRMRQLIDDLLAYSRVGTRGDELKPVDTEGIIRRAVANLQVTIQESGARVTHDSLPTVMGDKAQLAQLFQNLIGNGLKFHTDVPPAVHIAAQREGDFWRFSVRDNGIGIDEQYSERIFTIFQRLHSREEYAGTGIGLALCKKIVERHGGQIGVQSRVGEGATFCFTLLSIDTADHQ